MFNRAVVLLSGGLDSTTLAYDNKAYGYDVHLLSFNYGQKHVKELLRAARIAELLGARHDIINLGVAGPWEDELRPLASVLGNSALVSDTDVPDGHYADENMKQTVVPNRNAIMLSIAYGIALADEAQVVAFAAHAGDHAIYPDCRPEFVTALEQTLSLGNRWDGSTRVPRLIAPYIRKSKGEIAVLAHRLGVPIQETWSCYKGGDIHCGTCGTCYERREALKYAEEQLGLADPTLYIDSTTEFEAPVPTIDPRDGGRNDR